MKIGFIGAGKVGFTLGRYFADHGQTLTGYYSRWTEHAHQAAQFTNSTCYEDLELLVRDSDAIFITVVDSQISNVYLQVKEFDIREKFICHCSGAMTAAEAFPGIEQSGAFGYSLHPLFPISDRFESYKELSDAFFCLEGDGRYMEMWQNLLTNMGLRNRVISSEQKPRYHAAASVASNLVIALLWEAVELLTECGFSENEALSALTPLAKSNLSHVLEDGPIQALTGPLERGDASTIAKHLACLKDDSKKYEMYQAASQILLQIAAKKHPDTDYKRIVKLLNEEN